MPKKYVSTPHTCEWPYAVPVEEIDVRPKTFTFEAGEQERADLARRLNVVSVEEARASVTAQKAGGVIHAIGSVSAHVTQNCVVTLQPVQNVIEDEFEGWFGDKDSAVSFARARNEREAKKGHAEVEILEESVDPEPILNGKVDLGELATQYLSLGVDPYPRARDAASEYIEDEKAATQPRKSPFEALKNWKETR